MCMYIYMKQASQEGSHCAPFLRVGGFRLPQNAAPPQSRGCKKRSSAAGQENTHCPGFSFNTLNPAHIQATTTFPLQLKSQRWPIRT